LKRWIVVALALVAASAFAVSVQAGRWWTIGDAEIGPFGAHTDFGGPMNLARFASSDRWGRFGIATWAGGLVAMFVLVVLAGAIAAKRVPRLAAKTALIAIATATLAAIAFYLGFPSELPGAVDRGVPIFGAGIVFGLAAAIAVLTNRDRKW
jgi:hypothetical protein